jgi:hypothetical protein
MNYCLVLYMTYESLHLPLLICRAHRPRPPGALGLQLTVRRADAFDSDSDAVQRFYAQSRWTLVVGLSATWRISATLGQALRALHSPSNHLLRIATGNELRVMLLSCHDLSTDENGIVRMCVGSGRTPFSKWRMGGRVPYSDFSLGLASHAEGSGLRRMLTVHAWESRTRRTVISTS